MILHNKDLQNIHIFTTTACNLRCIMCTAKDKLNISPPFSLSPKILSNISNTIEYPTMFTFTGGEPLYYFNNNLDLLAELASNEKIFFSFISNGHLLSDKIVDILSRIDRGFQFAFSIDGWRKAYEEMRQGATWNNLVNKLHILSNLAEKNENINIFVKYIICNKTLYCLKDFVDFVKNEGLNISFIEPNSLLMDSQCNNTKLMLNNNEKALYKDILKEIDSKIEVNGDIKLKEKPFWLTNFRKPTVESKCIFPFYSLSIYYDGMVTPCCNSSNVILGNGGKEDIYNIWNGQKMQELRDSLLNGIKPGYCLCNNITLKRRDISDSEYSNESEITPNFSKERKRYIQDIISEFKQQRDVSILKDANIFPVDKYSIPVYSELAGYYLYRANEYNKCLEICDIILSMMPNHYETIMKQAIALYYLGNFENAIKLLNLLLDYEREHNILYFWLGFSYEKSDIDMSLYYYKKYIEIEKNKDLWGYKHALQISKKG